MSKDRGQYRGDRFEIASLDAEIKVARKFLERVRQGRLTKEENSRDHFCVYFAAYDLKTKEFFIGLHKKSGLWLFNGGHIDKGENPQEALEREMIEEWGFKMKTEEPGLASLRTITDVRRNDNHSCELHYDYWYFVPVDKTTFKPKDELLKIEFHEIGWKSPEEAIELVEDVNTLLAVNKISERFNN
jgi:8-oxo-dGTP pyrophosphatase MutT (NUDIX family)